MGEDSAATVVGAFGMAGGYEWAYRYHIPLRTELEFISRTKVTYDASPMLNRSISGINMKRDSTSERIQSGEQVDRPAEMSKLAHA